MIVLHDSTKATKIRTNYNLQFISKSKGHWQRIRDHIYLSNARNINGAHVSFFPLRSRLILAVGTGGEKKLWKVKEKMNEMLATEPWNSDGIKT